MIQNLIGRHEAAEILEVSTRTLDRYVKGKKLNSVRKKGRIFFRMGDVQAFQKSRNAHNLHVLPATSDEEIYESPQKYKILLKETKKELEKKDVLLMQLHQKLGFLESELRHSVPLLESRNAQKDLQSILGEQEDEIQHLQSKVHSLQVRKFLFFVIFLAFLIGTIFFFLLQSGV